MWGESSSHDSTPASAERSVVFHLVLVTLAGDEIQLPIELQEFDRFNEFENAVLENLPQIGKHSTFGCELEFVSARTRKILVDPIWDTLQECNCFNLIVRQCFTQAEHKGQLRQRVKAISVPSDDNDRVLPHAFSHVSDIRHVMVETGVHTIGEAAWQSCQRLQIVKLPTTVVCPHDGVFQRCYELRVVLVPGCRQFGRSVFEECCSLSQVGAAEDTTNQLAPQAQVAPHAFERCSALRHFYFEKTEANPANCTRYVPEGCFLGSGIDHLDWPCDFNFVGPAACESCKRLQRVDLSRTDLTAIWGSTFARCSHLEQLSLSKRLRRIGQEAFLLCSSLREVHTPPALLYIAHRAFSGCTQLSRLLKMKDKTTWRGPYVESNTFEMCHQLDMPGRINLLPPNQGSSRTFNAEEFDDELRRNLH